MKRKRGRPKLPIGEARRSVLTFRVTTEERQAIASAAGRSLIDESDWMRRALAAAAKDGTFFAPMRLR